MRKKWLKIVQASSCRLYTAMSVSPVHFFFINRILTQEKLDFFFVGFSYGVNIIAIFVSFSHSTRQNSNAWVVESILLSFFCLFFFLCLIKSQICFFFSEKIIYISLSLAVALCRCRKSSYFNYTLYFIYIFFFFWNIFTFFLIPKYLIYII